VSKTIIERKLKGIINKEEEYKIKEELARVYMRLGDLEMWRE